jgi:hypothetical protein
MIQRATTGLSRARADTNGLESHNARHRDLMTLDNEARPLYGRDSHGRSSGRYRRGKRYRITRSEARTSVIGDDVTLANDLNKYVLISDLRAMRRPQGSS